MNPNRDFSKLNPVFRRKLEAIIADLAGHGVGLALVEGWRSVARQQYLYAQGRTRPGPKVTYKDGVANKSWHQSGHAADICFVDGTRRYWPTPVFMPNGKLTRLWALLASSAKAHGVTWGGTWKMLDLPHLEIR